MKNCIGIIFFLLASSAWADRTWPDTTYDCQVKTVTGARGLVTIQAESPDQASESVVGKPALTVVGTRETSVSVTECVEYGQVEFKDEAFQQWRRNLVG